MLHMDRRSVTPSIVFHGHWLMLCAHFSQPGFAHTVFLGSTVLVKEMPRCSDSKVKVAVCFFIQICILLRLEMAAENTGVVTMDFSCALHSKAVIT